MLLRRSPGGFDSQRHKDGSVLILLATKKLRGTRIVVAAGFVRAGSLRVTGEGTWMPQCALQAERWSQEQEPKCHCKHQESHNPRIASFQPRGQQPFFEAETTRRFLIWPTIPVRVAVSSHTKISLEPLTHYLGVGRTYSLKARSKKENHHDHETKNRSVFLRMSCL